MGESVPPSNAGNTAPKDRLREGNDPVLRPSTGHGLDR